MRRLALVLVSTLFAAMLSAAIVEVYVRATWDPVRGRPGLFVADPVRIEKLSANYDGWFAGVPVRTNSLGFRDTREYDLTKRANVFRILVFGDSVTFGHGSVFEHTYPYLLERQLSAWRPDIDWQVWNLGIPGYNTSQELAQLLDLGPRYRPDLVIVGFFLNDVVENRPPVVPSRRARAAATITTWLRTHWYSYDLYRKAIVLARARLTSPDEVRRIEAALATHEQLLSQRDPAPACKQRLTDPQPLAPDASLAPCTAPPTEPFDHRRLEEAPGFNAWLDAVKAIGKLRREGAYDIAVFVNDAPATCRVGDVFDPRGTEERDRFFLAAFASAGLPAVSAHDAFLRYRPSQMPNASGHSVGNSNVVKADVLFAFLRDRLLPGRLLPGRSQTTRFD
jgi:lysophospholipase L1-like esterase